MDRKETTAWLSELLEHYLDPHNDPRVYWAREVTFDYSTASDTKRVDYMRFKPVNNSVSGIEKGDFYCYEIKSSVEDFHSKNGHNFIGDMNYYVMPLEVYEQVKNAIPWAVGVMCPEQMTISVHERWELRTVKKAHRKDRSRPVSEMLLMMWRSSRRELVMQRKKAAKEARGAEEELAEDLL